MTSSGTGLDEGISNPASARLEYDVFLSFCGQDTRYNFTSHLYTKLTESGIRVYKDNEELCIGEEIGRGLCQGIEQSKIAIPILSKGYATSRWCLDELVLILKCMRHGSLNVKPIFYDVKPSQVRQQTGSYKEAFELHMKNHGDKTISEWKRVLREVAQVKGWELSDNKIEEANLVKKVVEEVWDELKRVHVLFNEDVLVGLDEHVEEIISKINAKRSSAEAERSGAVVLGIYGMGGIGKTTLAKVFYNHLLPQFEGSSFVADIREKFKTKGSIRFLLKNLISDILSKEAADNIDTDLGFNIIRKWFCDRKVLILLDDVDDICQIKQLMEVCKCFSWESIIIITTRHEDILYRIKVDWRYELPVMQDPYARELFIKRAFQNNEPPEDYGELIDKAVRISGGLPLFLEIIGSLLRRQDKDVWERILKKLKDVPHEDVKKRLSISFETLDERTQKTLLDIGCFFIGVDHRMAIHFWDDDFHPENAIEVLQQRCLIKIRADNLIWMHDQMRDCCRDYIDKGHVGEPEKRRILWNQKQATGIFMKKMEAKSVRGLFLEFDMQSQWLFTAENFAKLKNLEFLQVKGDNISQDISFWKGLRTKLRLGSLLKRSSPALLDLKWLSWHHFPPTYKLNNFSLRNLVFLDLSESSVSDGWDRRSHIKIAERLKVLILSRCEKLTKTPNLSKNLLLEQLILEDCSSLIEIDSSIRMLKHLLIINLRGCRSLRKLPAEIGNMGSLTELILDDTSISCCDNIHHHRMEITTVRGIPESIGNLEHLSLLSLRNCSSILAFPKSIGGLVSIRELDLSCSFLLELPDSIIGKMKKLKILKVDGCYIRELPTSLGMLERLEVISADWCPCLESIPDLPHSLISLTVRSKRRMKRIPDFSNLTRLEHLVAFFIYVPCDPPGMEILWNIGTSSKLIKLEVGLPHIHIMHEDLGKLSYLKELVIERCHRLRSIPKLPSNLTMLRVDYCRSLRSLPDLSQLKRLRSLHIGRTPIDKVEGVQMLKNLGELVFDHCGIQRLPDMSILNKLQILEVKSCLRLVEIQGRSLESLKELDMLDCISLEKMPRIPEKERMDKCNIVNCGKFSLVEVEEEDPVAKNLKEATEDFDLAKMIQKKGADPNLSKKELLESNSTITPLFFLLLVLTLLAPKFLGFEPYRLYWLGISIQSIFLFIIGGFF